MILITRVKKTNQRDLRLENSQGKNMRERESFSILNVDIHFVVKSFLIVFRMNL